MGNKGQVGYPSDVSDEEWWFVAPYLALCREDAGQRSHSLRAVFNALRWLVKTGAHWRMMPNDLPPWPAVYQQTRRWIRAGCFEIMVEDLRSLLREFAGRKPRPTAMVVDSRTLQSTPESGARGGYDGAKRRKGSKVHAAVDTLGHLLALHVTAANEQDRAQVEKLAQQVQRITGDHVELAYVDQGYTGEASESAAARHGSTRRCHGIRPTGVVPPAPACPARHHSLSRGHLLIGGEPAEHPERRRQARISPAQHALDLRQSPPLARCERHANHPPAAPLPGRGSGSSSP